MTQQTPTNSVQWWRSIRTKLFVAFSTLVLFFAAFIYLYFPNRLQEQALRGAQDQAQSLATFLAYNLSPAIDFDDTVAAEETMQATRQNPELSYVIVTGKTSERFAGFGEEIPTSEDLVPVKEGKVSANGQEWVAYADVMRQQMPIGRVQLGLSLKALNAEVAQSRKVIALISVLFVVLGLGFVFWVATLVSANLNRIVRAVVGVGQGDFTKRAVVDTRDEVGILAHAFNEMTGRLAANTEALSRREAQFRNLAESMNEGLLQLGPDLRIQYVNPRLCKLLGYEEQAVVGQHLRHLTGDAQLPDFHQAAETPQMELQIWTTTDELRWILMSYSHGVAEADARTITVIFTDITHLKKTERDLVYKNRELDTFVYKASHDLKAPLSSLRGLVDIAKEEIPGPEAAQYLALLDRTISKMDDVLMGLLEVTWIKQGAMELQVIYLRDLVQTILRSIEHAPGFHTVAISLDIPDHCQVVSDLKLLYSVLQNLMHNAIKYHREEGDDKWVRITVTETPRLVRISIQDNGPGIPAHLHEKLFDMFFRASNKSQGSGLGLYIVKNSIEKLGGTVTLKSEVGVGTEFVVEMGK